MKKVLKTLGICLGFPILNLVIVSVLQSVSVFILNSDVVKENIYSLVFIGDLITLILIFFILIPTNYGIKDRINIKKIPLKEYFNIIILGIGVTILLLFLSGILMSLIPGYSKIADLLATSRESIIQLIITIVLIPVYEEIFYRGIIFGYLRKNFNIILAVLFQSLIFGFMHLNLVQGIYTFILGIVLALVYVYTDSILGNITIHIIFNLLGLLIIPKLLMKYPILSIILLIIGIIFSAFSIMKILKKYEKYLYE